MRRKELRSHRAIAPHLIFTANGDGRGGRDGGKRADIVERRLLRQNFVQEFVITGQLVEPLNDGHVRTNYFILLQSLYNHISFNHRLCLFHKCWKLNSLVKFVLLQHKFLLFLNEPDWQTIVTRGTSVLQKIHMSCLQLLLPPESALSHITYILFHCATHARMRNFGNVM